VKQEEIKCSNCGIVNSPSSDRCTVCGQSLKGTRILSERQAEVEVRNVNGQKRPLISRLPSFNFTFRKSPGRIHGKKTWLIPLSIFMVLIVLFSLFWLVTRFIQPTPIMPTGIGPDGIGVNLVDGEYIGISDGRYPLNIRDRDVRSLMLQASESLKNGNLGAAFTEWDRAHEKATNDAEPLIYAENQRVIASGAPYITIVLGVSFSVNVDDGFSRDALQAAYLVQKKCNENPQLAGGKKLRLLIASSGSNPNRSKDIAQQIVQVVQSDKTIVGVQGWPTSVSTLNAIQTLVQARLPIVAADTVSDLLTNISPYFFRIEAPSSVNVFLTTNYIEKKFAPQRLVILRDLNEPYSYGASQDFVRQFMTDGYRVAHIEDFKTADEGKLAQQVQNILPTYKPDLLYIPTINIEDIKTVLNNIPTTAEYANLKVLTGVEGYELVHPEHQVSGYTRMLISSSAFPDEWQILAQGQPEPPFFKDYIAAYDPHNQHIDSPYTYRRANAETMMGYDALSVFLVASKNAIRQGKPNPTPEDIKNALSQINSLQPFQGITGAIAFGTDGNPIKELHFVLRVDPDGHTHVAAYQGCLLINSPCDNSIVIQE